MYWKYHIESGDLIEFNYDGKIAAGTVRGWITDDHDDDATLDDFEQSDFELYVTSGKKDVTVNLEDVTSRVKKEDREGDLPLLGEEFRLLGGVEQV